MSFHLIGLGELLLDLLPAGRQLGGAPANFAYHVSALGAEGRIISRVGQDHDGRAILTRLAQLGVPTDCIQIDPSAPTGTVSVEISATGQPHYNIHENVAWDRLAVEENALHSITTCDAICFGTLAQRSDISRTAIRKLLEMTPATCLRVLDVNLRQNYFSREIIESSLALANVLKVNDHELQLIADMFALTGDAHAQLAQLAERFNLRTVACTRGDQGSLLLREGTWSDHSGIPATVVDTIGAGDSFTAAVVLGLLARWDLDQVNEQANRIAAYVASSFGATPNLPVELQNHFRDTKLNH